MTDLRVVDGRVDEIGDGLTARGESVLDADGGALLPGLHDHHLHLFALAAAQRSVRCGPPEVCDELGLARALRAGATGDRWIRGVGYHPSVAGELDRWRLDALESRHPVRVQHRSGALWVVNSRAAEALGLDSDLATPAGVERTPAGVSTGRIYAEDAWLRERLGKGSPPSLAEVGRQLAAFGVTGLTDATHTNGPEAMRAFERALTQGELPQRLRVMGRADLPKPRADLAERLRRGAVKILLRESALPEYAALRAQIEGAHGQQRAVAIHCVTRVELVFACAALRAAGAAPGDRIEHASVAPPELLAELKSLGLRVVTQPNFLRERGDTYLREVEEKDRPWLYRAAGLLSASLPLAGGTDAPFGEPDPWLAMRAAVERRTREGTVLASQERLSPEAALALFTSPLEQPGLAAKAITSGSPADFCLLDRAWNDARAELSSEWVRSSICAGKQIA